MSRPVDLKKLDAKLDLVITLLGDLDMEFFEYCIEQRKKNGLGGLTPHRGLAAELITH